MDHRPPEAPVGVGVVVVQPQPGHFGSEKQFREQTNMNTTLLGMRIDAIVRQEKDKETDINHSFSNISEAVFLLGERVTELMEKIKRQEQVIAQLVKQVGAPPE